MCASSVDWQGQPFSKDRIISLNEVIKTFYPLENSLEDGQIRKILKKSTLFEKKGSGVNNILSSDRNELPLSVIICTCNRAEFLKMTLESLISQTLDKGNYEVIIIDDGSSDSTKQIVDSFTERLPIKYFYQNNAGLASAKNHGIYAAQGVILFFLDDDDVAMPTLLEEHVKTHREYPEDSYAVLHYTTWSPNLSVTPLMHFITEVGCFLFSYPNIKHGDVLGYTYFWGGRSSCKRSFLIDYGVFNPVFRFGCEDIELGYRLSLHGLRVVFNSKAVCMMTRPITFDDFCQRLMKQGRSQYVFSTLHNDPNVHTWTEVIGAEETWNKIRHIYDAKIRSARELDKIVNMKLEYKFDINDVTKRLLHKAYWWAFEACKIKGLLDAKGDSRQKALKVENKEVPAIASSVPGNDVKSYFVSNFPGRGAAKHQFVTTRINSYRGFKKYVSGMQSEYKEREDYEESLLGDFKSFSIKGYCYVCKQKVDFFVDFIYSYEKDGLLTPNWRESLLCPLCGLNNRMRASVHLFEQLLQPHRESTIYISEQTTPLYNWFASNYANVVGSEYLGKTTPFGKMNKNGIRNENLIELSFSDNQFDYILSFDVFEHIPDYQRAFRECLRVLKPNGRLFFTVPFELKSEKNIVRAVMKGTHEIEHLLPPEYHGDPLNSKGCIAFYHFGWEMLSELKEIGFDNANTYLYWAKELGYLGSEQIVFVAERNGGKQISRQV